jgi:hypothetical protein
MQKQGGRRSWGLGTVIAFSRMVFEKFELDQPSYEESCVMRSNEKKAV